MRLNPAYLGPLVHNVFLKCSFSAANLQDRPALLEVFCQLRFIHLMHQHESSHETLAEFRVLRNSLFDRPLSRDLLWHFLLSDEL